MAIKNGQPFNAAFIALGTKFIYRNGVLCYSLNKTLRLLDIGNSADFELVIDVANLVEDGKFRFKPLHYGHSILAYMLQRREDRFGYLITIEVTTPSIVLFEPGLPYDEVTVDLTDGYLFLFRPRDYDNMWELCQYDLVARKWHEPRARFTSSASRRHNRVASAAHDGYFYIFSSDDPLLESGPPGEESSFHAIRIPLAGSFNRPIEFAMSSSRWAHANAPTTLRDYNWNFLSLETDESTGALLVVMIKKTATVRTCIRRVLAFRPNVAPAATDVANTSSTRLLNGGDGAFGEQGLQNEATQHDDDDLLHSLSTCFVRSYFSTSNTFVDLVNEAPDNGEGRLLRLRTSTETPSGGNETIFWPPQYHKSSPQMQEVHRILNPRGFTGNMEWSVDASSIVYGIRSNNGNANSLVYVGFDPKVKLRNLKSFNKTGQGSDSNAEASSGPSSQPVLSAEAPKAFPTLGVEWAWKERPIYTNPPGKNGFDFFAWKE